MTFSYGPGRDGQEADAADVEQTARDPADSTRTARRDSLSQDEAAALLLQIDGEPAAPAAAADSDATTTQELSGDELLEAMEAVTVEVTNEPDTLELQHAARDTTRDVAAEPSGISLPPSPESTPTLPASEAPKTPGAAAKHDAAPITVKPPSKPPSTMPTMIAPKSMGVPSRRHTDLFEDLARVAGRAAQRPVMDVKQLAGALGRPILDLEAQLTVSTVRAPPSTRRSIAAATSSPVTSVPRTQPYPFSSPIDPELSPVTEPASLPIPLMVTTARTAGVNDEPAIFSPPSPPPSAPPSAPPSVPLPLARLIEASIGGGERPTLESAQPIAIASAHVAQNTFHAPHAPVRPLVLPDLSGAAPVPSAFDPRLAYVDYAEGLARRQKAERAAATRATPRPRRSRVLLAAFASFALLIAATLFCATVLILQQRAPTASYATQPRQPRQPRQPSATAKQTPQPDIARARTSFPQSPMSPPSLAADVSGIAASPLGRVPATDDQGVPVLAVDLLPRVHNSHGILHVSKQFDGHRVFVDGAVMGNGAGDYELLCGRHSVKIGAQDRARIVTVPCGGDVGL